ncbi:MAG: YceI family protein [Bacteroidia bacterium]
MKKSILFLIVAFSTISFSKAQIYMGKESLITFYSHTAVEDIDAKNTTGKPVLDAGKGDIQVKVTIKGFKFKSGLMEEHFNENFLESDKYPHAIFKGKINEKIDYSKDGEHKVTVTGNMELHGVTKPVNVEGTLTVKGKHVIIDSKFPIKLSDYKIEDPSIIGKKVAEAVDVTIKSTLEPYKK